jgi:hypothetical protein
MNQERENQVNDIHVKNVLEKYTIRSNLGLLKYGTNLERNDLTQLEWLNHLQEELMDATLYIERIMYEIKNINKQK